MQSLMYIHHVTLESESCDMMENGIEQFLMDFFF